MIIDHFSLFGKSIKEVDFAQYDGYYGYIYIYIYANLGLSIAVRKLKLEIGIKVDI